MHHTLEARNATKEDGPFEALHIDALTHLFGKARLVFPRLLFVKLLQTHAAEFLLGEVARPLHEEYTGEDHSDADSGQQVHEDG